MFQDGRHRNSRDHEKIHKLKGTIIQVIKSSKQIKLQIKL